MIFRALALGSLCLLLAACGGSPTSTPAAQQPLLDVQPTLAAPAATDTELPAPTDAPTEEPTKAATAVPPTEAPTQQPAPTAVPQPTAELPTAAPPPAPTAAPAAAGCININAASFEELRQIPEIDEKIANLILQLRPFQSWNDLVDRVNGIGDKNVEQVKTRGCLQ
jgi:DNA uptake protein ComE-like DNA-binding protein